MTTLVSHQHSSELLEYLHRLYQENQLCDTTVHSSDGTVFSTHRVVLGSASAYLHQIFIDNLNDTVVCLDFTSAVLQILLQYCYTGQLQVSEQILPEVKQAAIYLQMHKVIDRLQSNCNIGVTKCSIECKAIETDMGAVTPNIKLELHVDSLDDDDHDDDIVSNFSDFKQDSPGIVCGNKSVSSSELVSQTKTKKTSKQIQSRVKCDNRQSISKICENEQVKPIRASTRKKKPKLKEDYVALKTENRKPNAETKFTRIKPGKAKKDKTKRLIAVKSLKSKKITGRKKSKKTVSKSEKTKTFENVKTKVNKCQAKDLPELKARKCDVLNKIFKPRRNPTKCDKCNISFSSYSKLKRHNLKLHPNEIIQLLCGQYILKRCLKGKQKVFGKRFCRKISTRLRTQGRLRNSTRLKSNANGLIQYIAIKLKQRKMVGSQLKQREHTTATKSSTRVLSPRHRTKKGSRIFQCPRCKMQLTAQYSLFRHLQVKHHISVKEAHSLQFVLPEALVCEAYMCNYTNSNLQEMRSHMKNKHPSIKHRCSQCQATFPLTLLLERHMLTSHKPGQTNTNQCDFCKKTFPTGQGLRRHKFFKHNIQTPGLKVLQCTHAGCGFKTLNAYALNLHKGKHTSEKPFTCETCGLKLKTKKSHRKHVEKMHLGIRPYLCQICGMAFGEDHELKAHFLCRHSGDKHYQCEYCPYSTPNKVTFYTHQFNVHNVQSTEDKREIYKCPHCPYTSLLGYRYKIHLNGHEGKRDYKCKFCDQTFISSNTRLAHMQWKHSENLFSCSQCEYQTKTRQKLNEHIRVQHQLKGIFPYRCPYCSFKCATGGNTRKHVKQVHKNMEVRYIRDDDLLAAAREARESGNHSGLLVTDAEEIHKIVKTDMDTLSVSDEQVLEIIC